MTDISIQLPDEVLANFCGTPQDFVKEMQLAAAIHWYQKGEISQEKAAQISGLNPQEFIRSLAQEKMDIFNEKKKLIHSLRGKYKDILTSSEDFSRQKQEEIDWEERNQ